MSLSWIDEYVDGVVDYCYSRDIFEIYNVFNINIKHVEKGNYILQENEAIYIRNYLGMEVVFIRNDIPYKYEKFILCHELGHALLHTELVQAAYNKNLINKGKLEKQANYFAIKLLGVRLDEVYYDGLSAQDVAKELCVSEESLDYIV